MYGGYTVLRVGQWRADLSGSSEGVPDLLVSRNGWGFLIGLEVKTEAGRVRPMQQALANAGITWIVRSFDDALAAVREVEGRYGLPISPALSRETPVPNKRSRASGVRGT